jgi:hypothetical protein
MIQVDFQSENELTTHETATMTYIRKICLMVLLCFSASTSYAAMVPTAQLQAESEPARTAEILDQRNHVKQQLIELGVDPIEAAERVNQLTDQQIVTLQGEIDKLPAGAGLSTTNLLLIIIVLILII